MVKPSTWFCLVALVVLFGCTSASLVAPQPSAAGVASRQLLQAVAAPGGACGSSIHTRCPGRQCCSQHNFCGVTGDHCGTGCQSSFGTCTSPTASISTPANPDLATGSTSGSNLPMPTVDDTQVTVPTQAASTEAAAAGLGQQNSRSPSGSTTTRPTSSTGVTAESAGGVSKQQFAAVFSGDRDKCGQACAGYSSNPNTDAVIEKHWGHFKSAAASQAFTLQNSDEASIFFGTVKHEYGGNLEQIIEFCGRLGSSCEGDYAPFYGRGPLQLTHQNNYCAMGQLLGMDLGSNPDAVADPGSNIGWQSAMAFWKGSNFNCQGSWAVMEGLPTCPAAAAAGNLAMVTRRLNPLQCAGGRYAAKQAARVAAVQAVRGAWGLGALAAESC